MDCRDVQALLHPYADGELDLVRHLQVEHHLAECEGCAERARGLRRLREAVAAAPLYHRAPGGLREKVRAALTPAEPAAKPRRRRWRAAPLAATAAGVLLMAAVALTGGALVSRGAATDRLAEEVVAGHVRSLQVAHLTDVASSDRHAVKPWFLGKLDFSPPVPDLTPRGFRLAGGRLDYLADRPVAALVYLRRDHAVNVFAWPAADGGEGAVRSLHRQGFHVRHWQGAGMTYWAVSDLNPAELDEFVRMFRESAAPP